MADASNAPVPFPRDVILSLYHVTDPTPLNDAVPVADVVSLEIPLV